MHIWTDIVARELLMLVVLFALGTGPASFLGSRFGAAARVAMAPVLGLCVGTCVFTTLIWFFAAHATFWLVPVLAAVSLTIAVWRTFAAPDAAQPQRRLRALVTLRSLGARDLLALAAVCIIVAAPLSYTLHERHSVGPAGFQVWDADGYTGETDGAARWSLREASRAQPPTANLTRLLWAGFASGTQQLDAVPLSANVNALVGLHAADTQTLFLIAFLVSGALGAFAAVRYAAPRPAWIAVLAGTLFAGPFFLQLMSDGSQAATCGLTLILPIAAVGADTLRSPRLANLALLALLAAGLMAIYPLFVPGLALSALVVVALIASLSWWRGRLTRQMLARAVAGIGLVLVLSVLFDLVGFLRDARYWRNVLNGAYYIEGFPQYHLPYSVLPGWLLQTREFYFLTELGSAPPKQILLGVILPIIFLGVIWFGLKHRRASLILVLPALICLAMAEYTNASHHCSYCTDRTLLPLGPLLIGLLVLGIAALAAAPALWLRSTAVVVAVVALVAVGQRTRQERVRFADGAYYLDSGNRALLSHLPPHPGAVDLEGYGQDPAHAPGELPLVYLAVWERNGEQVSLPTEYDDYRGLAYLGGAKAVDSRFNPAYRYVLTRLAGVNTGRTTIARTGPLALEERSGPLDVTVVSGVAVPPIRLNPQGLPSVVGPLHLLVVGGGPRLAWISLRFQTVVPVAVPRQPGVRAGPVRNGILTACVQASGVSPVRRGTIQLSAPLLPGLIPAEPFAVPEPPQGVQLVAMAVVSHCSLGGAADRIRAAKPK